RLIALTITRPQADLGLLLDTDLVPNGIGIGLGDRSLTVAKGEKNALTVTVTYNGIGFKNARVELRDPDGIVVDNQRTDDKGIAHFLTPLKRAGDYEVWASITDRQGDTLFGYESKIPGIA